MLLIYKHTHMEMDKTHPILSAVSLHSTSLSMPSPVWGKRSEKKLANSTFNRSDNPLLFGVCRFKRTVLNQIISFPKYVWGTAFSPYSLPKINQTIFSPTIFHTFFSTSFFVCVYVAIDRNSWCGNCDARTRKKKRIDRQWIFGANRIGDKKQAINLNLFVGFEFFRRFSWSHIFDANM